MNRGILSIESDFSEESLRQLRGRSSVFGFLGARGDAPDTSTMSLGLFISIVTCVVVVSCFGIVCCYKEIRNARLLREAAANAPHTMETHEMERAPVDYDAKQHGGATNSETIPFASRVSGTRHDHWENRRYLPFRKGSPRSGTYKVATDKPVGKNGGGRETGTYQIYFVEEVGTFNLTGKHLDARGTLNIAEGVAGGDGSAWWRETNAGGHSGLEVLAEGRFNFKSHTFEGQWWTNQGRSGKFVNFRLEDDRTTTSSVQPY